MACVMITGRTRRIFPNLALLLRRPATRRACRRSEVVGEGVHHAGERFLLGEPLGRDFVFHGLRDPLARLVPVHLDLELHARKLTPEALSAPRWCLTPDRRAD